MRFGPKAFDAVCPMHWGTCSPSWQGTAEADGAAYLIFVHVGAP